MSRSDRGWDDRDDRGMITAYVAVLSVGLLFMAAMVFDGGRRITTYLRAHDLAANASRAAAQAVEPSSLYGGGPADLAVEDAQFAAEDYIVTAAVDGAVVEAVVVNGDQVTVTISLPFDPALLPMVAGPVSAEATSTAIQGVDAPIES